MKETIKSNSKIKSDPGPEVTSITETKIDESIPFEKLAYYTEQIKLTWRKTLQGILACSRNVYAAYEIAHMDREIFETGRDQGVIHSHSTVKELKAFREKMGNLRRKPASPQSASQANGHPASQANERASSPTSAPFKAAHSTSTVDFPASGEEEDSPASADPHAAAHSPASEAAPKFPPNFILVELNELDEKDALAAQELRDRIKVLSDDYGCAGLVYLVIKKMSASDVPEEKVPKKPPRKEAPARKEAHFAHVFYHYENSDDCKRERNLKKVQLEMTEEKTGVKSLYDLADNEIRELEKLTFDQGFNGEEGRYRRIRQKFAKSWLDLHPEVVERSAARAG